MLSLEALSPRAELRRQATDGLVGRADGEQNAEKHLLKIQMNIVRETAKFGPVLLLAPDEATKSAVVQRCQEFQICELLKSDRVRMKVVPHDGVWIRDFGPQIEATGDRKF
jgi:agmatine/peptidylarginine deiminase